MQFKYPRFLAHLEHERHLTRSTVQRYEYFLTTWFSYLAQIDTSPFRAGPDEAAGWVALMKGRGYKNSYLTHIIAYGKGFYRWATLRGMCKRNPFADVERPKVPQTLPRYLTREEVERLLGATPSTGTPLDMRDRAILELMYSTGCRNSEVRAANLEDVDLDNATIKIRDIKNAKERMAYLTPSAVKALRDYLALGRPSLALGADRRMRALFLSQHRRRLCRDTLSEVVDRAGERAKLEKRVTPHMIRHSFATHMLEEGVDVRHVQEFLGHARLNTTQIYTHVTNPKLREVFFGKHPGIAQASD